MPSDLTEKQAYLALNALPGIGPIGLNQLLDGFGGDPRAALSADRRSLESVLGSRTAAISSIRDWRAHFDPAKEEAKMEKSGVSFLTPDEPGYPALLGEISDPPVGLYRKGNYAFENPCVAVVGSRRATAYGQSIAKRLGAELAQRGFCVVSGLARGVDTAAHEGALSVGGRTAAVLGTGIDIIYPPENLALYRRIAETGAIVSECPFGRAADRDSFPMRSRIVSGICEAVVVVESDMWGGAMTTAKFAGEQGRLLFAVPGRIDQSTSGGTNQLIRDGATMLTRVEDLLQEIQYLGGLRPAPLAGIPAANASEGLGPDEARILYHLRGEARLSPRDLAAQTGIAAGAVGAALMLLEGKGFVARAEDGSYGAGSAD
ncbi:MAG TPA: DNA-processing protein DprA [Opitutaceae bacterium]